MGGRVDEVTGNATAEREPEGREALDPEAVLPNFCVVGAMRCGTTSLANYLRSHPQVFMAKPKELRFFDHEDHDLRWYSEKFKGASSKTAIGEATPNYLFSRKALARMRDAIPNCRLIAVLRNPIDRAYSHYWLWASLGMEARSFDEAVSSEMNGEDPIPEASYLARGLYQDQIDYLLSLYPENQLKVVLFEDLAERLLGTYRELCSFLGIDESFLPGDLGRRSNPFVTFRSVRLRSLTKRWPATVRNVLGRFNARPSAYPEMTPLVRTELRDYFAPANARLATWLGRDLSEWV